MAMTLEKLSELQTSTETVFSLHNRRLARRRRFSDESGFKEYAFFSVRKSSMIQFKTKLDMSMVANSKEDRCDFRIDGSWFKRSCAIYARDTNNDIAQTEAKNIVSDQRSKLLTSRSAQRPML
ncbi:hypothetical protein SASPL_108259 [Salvia splendens]|uniref:Uncharacterized protein n=1 Tax=Salvia splendens TaxID=180675 RepID=A0A8X9A622_SALSN|nr:hypothetical protein SASPL_108259 [Salvia splendens]